MDINIINKMKEIFNEKLAKIQITLKDYKIETLDDKLLSNYSRLLKMRDWLTPGMNSRYFSHEGARLLLAEKLNIKARELILDVGSGDGWFSIQAALFYRDAKFYGIELSEEFAEAMEYAKIFELENVFFFYFDAYDLIFPNERFDKIALFFALSNIAISYKNLRDLFLELRRILKHGGLIGISEPFIEDFPRNMGIFLKDLYDHCYEKDETLLYHKEVEQQLLETGFKIKELFKIPLHSTGAPMKNIKEYLEEYYGIEILKGDIKKFRNDKIWVRDDPPQYTIIIAQKS